MTGHQEADHPGVVLRELQPLHRRLRELQTAVDVVGAFQALAGVVQQQRQEKQFGTFDLGEQFGERPQRLHRSVVFR